MFITPIKLVQVHSEPFKNTCMRLSDWISPFCAIHTTSQGKRRVGLLLTNQILVINSIEEKVTMQFEEFGEVTGTAFGCVPQSNLTFYYLGEDIAHHRFKNRKRNLTTDTFLFGFLPFAEPVFYRFQPIDIDDSKMFDAFRKDKTLNLGCSDVANALPIWDMAGELYGFSIGNYNDESAVIPMKEIAKALKK